MMQHSRTKQIGECLMQLAELLTDDDCEITADDLLENITGRSISEEDARSIVEYLSTIPEKCPTCGSDVLVISVDEGTSYYEPCCTDKEKYDLHMEAKKYREALANLVDLKKHKDQYGKDAEYLELQPKVWEIAFKALGA